MFTFRPVYQIKLYFKGPQKTKCKKPSTCSTESSIVVPTSASGMIFPYNEAVANATHKKKEEEIVYKNRCYEKEGGGNHYFYKYRRY